MQLPYSYVQQQTQDYSGTYVCECIAWYKDRTSSKRWVFKSTGVDRGVVNFGPVISEWILQLCQNSLFLFSY